MSGQNLKITPNKIPDGPRRDPIPEKLKKSYIYQGKEVPNLITDYDLVGFGDGIVKYKAKEMAKLVV
jgi:hypothetical protein